MEFDTLKSDWKKTGNAKKNQEELLMMTKIKNHPIIKRIRIRFFIEILLLLIFTFLYYNGFDGDAKPLWANLLLISAATFYIIIRFVGLLLLRNPIKGDTIKKSLVNFQYRLKQTTLAIVASSFLLGIAIILFFSSSISITKEKSFILMGMVLSLVLLIYILHRNWFKIIKHIKTTLAEFDTITH